jgi:hypothetical protein
MTQKFSISRPCYDKFHRCPGWAGGGMKCAKVTRCEGGHIKWPKGKLWRFKTTRCDKCNIIVLPYHIRWVDWGYLKYVPEDIKRWRENR